MTKLSLTVKTDDFTSGRMDVELDPQSPDSDQHQSSPNNNPSNVKGKDYSTKEKVLCFLIKFSQLIFQRNQ